MIRLIDANLNRMAEGLRVLEDIARFHLDDAEISRQLKTLRHELLEGSDRFELLAARRSAEDVGASIKLPGEVKRTDLQQIVIANSRRVQESLRVLEGFAKMSDTPLTIEPLKFEKARFSVYEIEKRLVSALLRKGKANRLTGLYLILDTAALSGRDEAEVARQAIHGGAKVIQLRDKQHKKGKLLGIARRINEVCAQEDVLFIINDHVDIAMACGADGVHLGQSDMPLPEARSLLAPDKIIGCSTHNLMEAERAEAEGADYIAVGSIYPTNSKEEFTLAELETLRQIREKTLLPIIAIGGINDSNAAEVTEAGAGGIAVISAVLGAEDVKKAARKIVDMIERDRCEDG